MAGYYSFMLVACVCVHPSVHVTTKKGALGDSFGCRLSKETFKINDMLGDYQYLGFFVFFFVIIELHCRTTL